MNHRENASSSKSLFGTLAGLIAVVLMSGCAAMGPADVQDPVDSPHHGASLDPNLGSVALRVADAASQLRGKSGS